MKVTIQAGYGFWDITHYPLGGCFKRVPRSSNTGLEVTIVGVIDRPSHGCDRIGVDSLGQRIAFNSMHAVQS